MHTHTQVNGIHRPEKRKLTDVKPEIMQVLEQTDQDFKMALITTLSKGEYVHSKIEKKKKKTSM